MIFFIKPLLHWSGGILFYLCPSVQDIFRRIFLSNYWWQKSDIWSQASYWYAILWEAFLDPSDSYFLFADYWFLYTLKIYANFSSHFSQQLLMAELWYLVTIFILVCNIVGSVFGSIRFLLPVCRLGFYTRWTYMLGYHKWALAHSSSCLTLLHLKIYFFRFVANLVQNNITLFCGYTMHLFFSSVYYTIVIYMATPN
jgi:hypothetical protein